MASADVLAPFRCELCRHGNSHAGLMTAALADMGAVAPMSTGACDTRLLRMRPGYW